MIRLKTTVTAQIDLTTDSVLVCDLGPLIHDADERIDIVGAASPVTGHGPLVL